jgi:3'-5' exoribonuclease
MPPRVYISDFEPNQLVEGVFAVQNCQLGLTRSGKPYIKCLLADKTGRLPGRMWNASEELSNQLPTDGFVRITGQTQPYQGELQVIVQQMEAVEPRGSDLLELIPSTDKDINAMFAELRDLLGTIESPSLAALAQAYLDDEKLMGSFKQAPAAMALHHAYLGGLLEHTLQVLKLAESTLPHYPELNRDIVLCGLFLHDLAKCVELTWTRGFGYSDDGRLVGHIVRGAIWLQAKADQLAEAGTPVPEAALAVLHHIVISHHGEPEYGAAKPPSTPEAWFVHLIDNLDAKMHMAIAAARATPGKSEELGGHFTDKVWALGNVRLYRPDPLADETVGSAPPAPAEARQP